MIDHTVNTLTHALRRQLIVVLLVALAGCASTAQQGSKEETAAEENAMGLTRERTIAAGDEAARRGNYQAALKLYGQVLNEAPTAELWFKAGAAQFRLNEAARAAHAFAQCIALDPDNVDAHEQIGLLYVATRDIDTARPHLERAVALDPKRWESHNGLGVLADLEHDYARAQAHYQRALEVRPDSPMLYNNLGYSRYLAGDLDSAARDFTKALTLDTNYRAARRNLGLVYARRGAYDDAVKTLVPILGEPAAYNDVGYVALLEEDYETAEVLLTRAMERSPTFNEAAARNLEIVRQRLHRLAHTDGVARE
jgi:Flp pilus assembly protein TadD